MIWFWKLHTGRQFFLANVMNFNFVFFGGTPDALTGKLRFFQPGKLRDDLTLLEILPGEITLLLL